MRTISPVTDRMMKRRPVMRMACRWRLGRLGQERVVGVLDMLAAT